MTREWVKTWTGWVWVPQSPSSRRIEDIITAWAYAHDINGAVRNDLFSRLRAAAPEGDTVIAEQRRLEKYGDPHAGIVAAALQSRVSPQAGMREALEYIVRQDGKGSDGLIDWQRCVDRIQESARAALSSPPTEGEK